MPFSNESLRLNLCQLGREIRDTLYSQQSRGVEELSSVAAQTTADTIYQIDKVSEELILEWLKENWPTELPVRLVMEGIEDEELVTFPEQIPAHEIQYTLIVDPIDGTRGLMYDKRPAWALIGLAKLPLDRKPTLEDISVAVMTELPTSKQFISEQLSAHSEVGGSLFFERVSTNMISGKSKSIPHTPSKATDLNHGFVSVAKFFPQAKAALALFEEDLLAQITPEAEKEEALIFDDQYISTGGQLYELIAGHDRLTIDIRPIAFKKAGLSTALTCHPYDLAALLVARAAGVVVTSVNSEKLEVPLDTTTSVSWIAYANCELAQKLQPVIEDTIQRHFD